MPRPQKCRRVDYEPEAKLFRPAGVATDSLQQVLLSLDELEAVRLADLQGMYQEEAARHMEVSRQTFGNIVASARRKLADCVVHGKALRIEGGAIRLCGQRNFTCRSCHCHWAQPYGSRRPAGCPACHSRKFQTTLNDEKEENKHEDRDSHRE